MDVREASGLIEVAVPRGATTWSDLGAGSGTFTRALALLLGPGGHVYAVERDPSKMKVLQKLAHDPAGSATIVPVHADFTQALELPELDGTLLANALHYVPADDQVRVLAAILGGVREGGRLVIVDYDGRTPNQWVPFPVSIARFRELAAQLGLTAATVVGSVPSAYGGTMYAAYAVKRSPNPEP
jgi:SAM-dependent methyltransferase